MFWGLFELFVLGFDNEVGDEVGDNDGDSDGDEDGNRVLSSAAVPEYGAHDAAHLE